MDIPISFQPSTSPSPHEAYDEQYYGNLSRGFQRFLSALTGANPYYPTISGENFCRHATYSGEFITKQVDFPSFVDDYSFFNYHGEVVNHHGYMCHGITVDSVDPFTYTPYNPFYWWNINISIMDILKICSSGPIRNISGANPYIHDRTLSDLEYALNPDALEIRYHMTSHNIQLGDVTEWDSRWRIPIEVPTSIIDPVPGTYYNLDFGSGVEYTYTNASIIGYGGYQGPAEHTYTGTGPNRVYRIILSSQQNTDAERGQMGYTINLLRDRSFLVDFARAVDSSWADFVPSCMFSTVDAFNEAEGSISRNVLRDLKKLPSIIENIELLRDAIDVGGRLLNRDIGDLPIGEILHLLSSIQLRYSFEWRPLYELLTSYLPQLLSTWQSMAFLRQTAIGHGSFTFHITNDLGRKEVTLRTRTKLVMDTSPSGLLSAALGVDALGLLPKPSTLWSLVPFSFLANWFTGVGDSMRRAEYSLLLSTIPAYFVHTYLISSPLTDDELETLKASTTHQSPATLRLFYRDVSLYSPVPRDSRFGFGVPTGIPFVGTLGSLLYQKIFS